MAKHYYYQIDYVDVSGQATYIDTFTARQRKKALEHLHILNNANNCVNKDTYFVLDKYVSYSDDEFEVVEENILK